MPSKHGKQPTGRTHSLANIVGEEKNTSEAIVDYGCGSDSDTESTDGYEEEPANQKKARTDVALVPYQLDDEPRTEGGPSSETPAPVAPLPENQAPVPAKPCPHLVFNIVAFVMRDRDGVSVTKQLWGLSRKTDLETPRGLCLNGREENTALYNLHVTGGEGCRYPLVRVKVAYNNFNRPLIVAPLVRTVRILHRYNCPVTFPENSIVEKVDCKAALLFDQPLALPRSVREVSLSLLYRQPIVNLPPKFKELILSPVGHYNHPLDLPDGIRKISLSRMFDHPLALPHTLKILVVPDKCMKTHPLDLPEGLEEVYIGDYTHGAVTIPASVRRATFGPHFTQSIHWHPESNLVSLGWYLNKPISLPTHLKKLTLGVNFQQPLDLTAELGLEELTVQGPYNGLFDLTLPSSVRKLLLPANIRSQDRFAEFEQALKSAGCAVLLYDDIMKVSLNSCERCLLFPGQYSTMAQL